MKEPHSKSNEDLHEVAQERNDKQVGKVDKETMTDLEQPTSEEGSDVDNENEETMTDLPTCEYGRNERNEVRKVDQQTMTDLPTSEEQRNDKDVHNEVKIIYQSQILQSIPNNRHLTLQ